MKLTSASAEVAAAAARCVVEEGMEYGAAKRAAARQLGVRQTRSQALPSNEAVEAEVRIYLAIFCADTQPVELAALRVVAAAWMERLAEFRPHLTGTVWRGTATRLNNVHLQLFCDDSKAAELALIEQKVPYEVGTITGPKGQLVDVLSLSSPCRALGLHEHVTVHLSVLDYDDLRGALKPDATGRSLRGDLTALRQLMEVKGS
jgi:hypothetical protein